MDSFPLSASLRDLAFILFKRKWSIFFIFFGTILVSFGYLLIVRDDVYLSGSKILIKIGHEQAPPPTVLGQAPSVVGYRNQDVNSEIDIIKSSDLIQKLVVDYQLGRKEEKTPPERWLPWIKYVIKDVVVEGVKENINKVLVLAGIRRQLDPQEMALELMSKGIVAEAIEDSNVIVVALALPYKPVDEAERERIREQDRLKREAGEPLPEFLFNDKQEREVYSMQAMLLRAHIENYLKFRSETAYKNQTSVGFFQGQVDETKAKLEEAESKRQQFEEAHNIVQIEEQKRSLIEQIASARQTLDAAQRQVDQAQHKVNQLDAMSAGPDPDFGRLGEFVQDSFPQDLLARLTTLQMERELLRPSEGEDSVRIRTNRAQFLEVMKLISSNLRSVLDEKLRQAKVAQEQLEALEDQLATLHANEKTWRELVRDCSTFEESLRFYTRKLEESHASGELESSKFGNATVIDKAKDPILPTGIRKTYLLLAAGIFSVLAALAWAAVAEFFDHRIYSGDALEKHLGAPVLAIVPRARGLGTY